MLNPSVVCDTETCGQISNAEEWIHFLCPSQVHKAAEETEGDKVWTVAIRSVKAITLSPQTLRSFAEMSSRSMETEFAWPTGHPFFQKLLQKQALILQHILNVRYDLWNETSSLISFYYWIKVFQMLIKITWESRRKTMNHSQRRNESVRES